MDYEALELARYDALMAWLDSQIPADWISADEAVEALADAASDDEG